MTFRVLKSQISPQFEAAVAAHAFDLRTWREHMQRVAEDAKNDVPAIERHVAYDPPAAHPLVAEAVNELGVADYEIVDDGPTPEQVLAAKKAALFNAVAQAEFAAIASVAPGGKLRLFNYRENDIRAADQQLAASLAPPPPGLLSRLATKVGLVDQEPVDIPAELEARRPPEDTQHLAEQNERRQRMDAIERQAAQAHHDIEDLTLENIDAWQLPDFSK